MKTIYTLGWVFIYLIIITGLLALNKYVDGNWGTNLLGGWLLFTMMEYADKKWDEKIKEK